MALRTTTLRRCSWLVLLLGPLVALDAGCGDDAGIPGAGVGAAGAGGAAGATGTGTSNDADGDGVADDDDNCVDVPNPHQTDTDLDGEGDACEYQDGTLEFPFLIPGDPLLPDYRDARDTHDAPSDAVDAYPGYEGVDESGPEFFYLVRLDQATVLSARLKQPEPAGTDVDVHVLSSADPIELVARDDVALTTIVDPGYYYLTVDTFAADGTARLGAYELTVALQAWHAGTVDDPLLPGEHPTEPLSLPFLFQDTRDTTEAPAASLDAYPGYETLDESGPEYVYRFTVAEPARLAATIAFDEPAGTDIDLHLLSSLEPLVLVARGDTALYALLEPGTYYLVADTYADSSGPRVGPYELRLSIRSRQLTDATYLNDAVLAAVDYLWASYRLLGYDAATLTHDVPYGSYGVIQATGGARTMCVAAAMEVILTALNIWAEDRGDATVFDFLPKPSWETLDADHIKAHIWVNHSLDSYGTADALAHFGMGETVPFSELRPGSFINLNRTTGTGHAVVFLSFIDLGGNEYESWNEDVVGFRYFSSQGGFDVGTGGLDFRYAVFSQFGSPPMPGKRDLNVIDSDDPHVLNTGMMWAPPRWTQQDVRAPAGAAASGFDPRYFDGVTADD